MWHLFLALEPIQVSSTELIEFGCVSTATKNALHVYMCTPATFSELILLTQFLLRTSSSRDCLHAGIIFALPVKMPGYELAKADLDSLIPKYKCSSCKRLLRDAMQTSCGHLYCLSCLDNLIV